MTQYIKIAVLMTCHNRKETTQKCLTRLSKQVMKNIQLDLFAVDDGSKDGTAGAIKEIFPDAVIIQGNGRLFWSGGMREAFSASMIKLYDYYLWLNNDTMLSPDAIQKLLYYSNTISKKINKDIILVGSLTNEQNGTVTYGGKKFNPLRPKISRIIEPTNKPECCDVVNGNCVLITQKIAQTVGNFSPEFIHSAADYDYSLRAKAHGFTSWIAPGYFGTCAINPIKTIKKSKSTSLKILLDNLSKDAAKMRIKDSIIFIKKHGKTGYLTYFFSRAFGIFILCVANIWSILAKLNLKTS